MKKFSKIFEQDITLTKSEDTNVNNTISSTDTESTQNEEKGIPSKFFSKLFESREMSHVYHLQVRGEEGSFSTHKALNEYYEGVILLIDTLIEVYQGQYDIIQDYDMIDTKDTKTKDKLEYFIDLSNFIKESRYTSLSKEDTHLQNIIDEMVALVYRTLYKLKNLQ